MLGGAHNKVTGDRVTIPPAEQREPDWFAKHEWRTDLDALKQLKAKAKDKQMYVCGVTPNDEQILPLFDEVFYLSIDEQSLESRIINRQGNDYGKNENELADIMQRKAVLDARYMNSSAEVLDASGDVMHIVSRIIG
jgi:hypothetical protein